MKLSGQKGNTDANQSDFPQSLTLPYLSKPNPLIPNPSQNVPYAGTAPSP